MDEQNEVKHPQAIDLGLPSGTKWASCNVGADQPWECGGYYAWGETEEKEVYDDITYMHNNGTDTDGDGRYDEGVNYQNLDESICGTMYDIAHVKMGDDWKMPSIEQIEELFDYCFIEWTTIKGVEGCELTGPNGNGIFLPAAGARHDSNPAYPYRYIDDSEIPGCYYWSGTQNPEDDSCAYAFHLNALPLEENYRPNVFWRSFGFTIRPVTK